MSILNTRYSHRAPNGAMWRLSINKYNDWVWFRAIGYYKPVNDNEEGTF